MATLSGEITQQKLLLSPFQKRFTQKKKKKKKFTREPFLKRFGIQESKQEVTKVLCLINNGRKFIKCFKSL